jgi:hypothetical protein
VGAKTLRGGRPPRLTVEVADAIAATVRAGGTIEDAAGAAGVSRRSVFAWLEVGRRERANESVHLRLLRLVEEAWQAQCAGSAAPTNWEEAARLLELESPGRWALDDALAELDALDELSRSPS